MGLFSKPEVVVLKESNDARTYLSKLEELLPKVQGELKKKIEKEILSAQWNMGKSSIVKAFIHLLHRI